MSLDNQGQFVGSGVTEARCRGVIAGRLKCSGMFWTVSGANSIIALRCAQLSNRFDNYWEYHAAGRVSHSCPDHPLVSNAKRAGSVECVGGLAPWNPSIRPRPPTSKTARRPLPCEMDMPFCKIKVTKS